MENSNAWLSSFDPVRKGHYRTILSKGVLLFFLLFSTVFINEIMVIHFNMSIHMIFSFLIYNSSYCFTLPGGRLALLHQRIKQQKSEKTSVLSFELQNYIFCS